MCINSQEQQGLSAQLFGIPHIAIAIGLENGSPSLPRFFGAVLPRRSAVKMDFATRQTFRSVL